MAHSDFDPEIEELAEDHEEAETTLLALILAYLSGQMLLEEAAAAIDEVASALGAAAQDWVEEVTPRVYLDGVGIAANELADEISDEVLSENHAASLDLLQEDLNAELIATNARMSDDARNTLREIARRRISNMMATGSNALPEASTMAQDLRERGIRFTDRANRRWEPRAYSRMLLRTHSVKISNEANLNAAGEIGSKGVRVSDGGPSDSDPPCIEANGQIWRMDYARAHTLEHPNCRRAFAPLPSTYEGPFDR